MFPSESFSDGEMAHYWYGLSSRLPWLQSHKSMLFAKDVPVSSKNTREKPRNFVFEAFNQYRVPT